MPRKEQFATRNLRDNQREENTIITWDDLIQKNSRHTGPNRYYKTHMSTGVSRFSFFMLRVFQNLLTRNVKKAHTLCGYLNLNFKLLYIINIWKKSYVYLHLIRRLEVSVVELQTISVLTRSSSAYSSFCWDY
jgi:hypothetical protein